MKKNYAVSALLLAVIGFYGCALSTSRSQVAQSSHSNASSDVIISEAPQIESDVSTSDVLNQEKSEAEIIAACVLYFEKTDIGSQITEPFSSIKEYQKKVNGELSLQILTHNKLLQLDNIEVKSAMYGEQSIPCYPSAICDKLTNQMFGISLNWTDKNLEIPEGTFVMPYGYGGTMVSAEILKENCYIKDNEIYLTATAYWNEYGEKPKPIKQLLYQFEYMPENDLCQFLLVSLSAENIE